jgi:hypothetical protein
MTDVQASGNIKMQIAALTIENPRCAYSRAATTTFLAGESG